MKARYTFLCVSLLAMLVFSACSHKGNDVLSEKQMEDILYDYHLSQGLAAQSSDSTAYNQWYYSDLVFKKYGITEADFNRSLEWYMAHAEKLEKIYQRVSKRFSSTSSQTAQVAMVGKNSVDTTDVWKSGSFFLLNASGSMNKMYFSLACDSSYHPGDRLQWVFNTTFIYSEGARQAMAVISIRYVNDSVESRYMPVYSGGKQVLEVGGNTNLPIKNVSGFIYQEEPWNVKPKLLIISGIALLRIHKSTAPMTQLTPIVNNPPPAAAKPAVDPSLTHPSPSTDSARDRKRSHFTEIKTDAPGTKHKEHFSKGKLIRE